MDGSEHLLPVSTKSTATRRTDQLLRFGDQIVLYDSNASRPGFVHCASVGGDYASVLVSCTSSETNEEHPDLTDVKMGVFQIHAQSKYKAAKRLRQQLDKLREKMHKPKMTLDEALLDQNNRELQTLNRLAEAERADNEFE
jgi:hypothetical protein